MKTNYDENIFIARKDDIYTSEPIDDSYRKENPNENYINIFSYENLTVEYDFQSGKAALYIQRSEQEYELLYESSIVDDIENSSFYSKDNAYILINYNHKTGDIEKLDCIPKTSFIQYAKKFSKNFKSDFINSINEFISTLYIAKHSTNLIYNNNNYNYSKDNSNQKLFKEYRKLFVQYNSAKTLIPVSSILDEVITNIHKYISTGKLDIEKIKKNFLELQNFKDVCNNSISLIGSFINNPNSTDLRSLCDGLEKNLHNIDNLIDLYLEDELILQDKEYKNDCK